MKPETTADNARLFFFLSFILIYIAVITAVCAKEQPKEGDNSISKPFVVRLISSNGVNAQCNPNITRICQKNPITAPEIIGEKLYIDVTASDKILVNIETTGPITIRPIVSL